ncbi:anti-sigma factor family protein [Candidatus Mycobacterium methanotrophicum]
MDRVGPDKSADTGGDPQLTVEALAELQAGLLDDDTAARLRKSVRADPHAQQTMDALNRVRRDIAALGADASSASEVPPRIVDAVAAALRAERPQSWGVRAAHTVRTGALPRPARLAVALAGLAAVVVAIWLGTSALISSPAPTPSRPTTAEHITVSRPPTIIPLSDQQILDLLGAKPDFGPFTDPHLRISCLDGLGYPADAQVLGARPVEIAGRPAIVLVLPGDTPDTLRAVAVPSTCSAVDTGLLADRIVNRP